MRAEANPRPRLAILFDCDGVLADTERDGHRVSFNKVFAEKGYSFEWGVDEYGKLCEVGGGKERMTHYFDANGWPEGLEDVVAAFKASRPTVNPLPTSDNNSRASGVSGHAVDATT